MMMKSSPVIDAVSLTGSTFLLQVPLMLSYCLFIYILHYIAVCLSVSLSYTQSWLIWSFLSLCLLSLCNSTKDAPTFSPCLTSSLSLRLHMYTLSLIYITFTSLLFSRHLSKATLIKILGLRVELISSAQLSLSTVNHITFSSNSPKTSGEAVNKINKCGVAFALKANGEATSRGMRPPTIITNGVDGIPRCIHTRLFGG